MPAGIDSPKILDYIVPVQASAMKNRDFDYDLIVRPLEPRMMRTIWRIVRERASAEDALQNALTVIWKKRDTVARHPNPEALILRIAVAAACDILRKNRRRLSREVPGRPEERADAFAATVTEAGEDGNLRIAIIEAIGRLPKRQAAAMLLRIIEEQSYEEIARAMDCSESTARIHVMRGKAALSRRLADFQPVPPRDSKRTGKRSRHESE